MSLNIQLITITFRTQVPSFHLILSIAALLLSHVTKIHPGPGFGSVFNIFLPRTIETMKKRFKNWLKSNSNAGSFGIAHESLPRSSSMAHESLPTSSSLAQELSPNYNPSDAPQPSNLAENLKISGRFALSVLPRIAGCVDENPAKMAFKFLNLIMQVRTVSSVSTSNFACA